LFLGYKGSGKSALGEHLRLVSQGSPHLFVRFVNIADVSFSTFSQIMKGNIEPEARYPMVWSWLLLLFLFDSFCTDEGSDCLYDTDFIESIAALKKLGLLPNPNLSEAVTVTSDKSFSLKLGTIVGNIEATFKTAKRREDFPFSIDRLKLVARRFTSTNRHLLIIDGFDELLRRGTLQYDALGGLVFESNRLNMELTSAKTSAKVILLCRTDLFERLPSPNKNKIRQNAAVHIDWYCDPRNAASSHLVKLINHRASLATGSPIDVFATFLPPSLDVYSKVSNLQEQLLENTRHTPRDMIMLFKHLQDYSGENQPMTRHQVMNALTAYSRDYLQPEIIDELNGYLDVEHVRMAIQLLGSLRKRSPTVPELENQVRRLRLPEEFDLQRVLSALFDCSAIGNVDPASAGYPIFKYRSRYASYNPDRQVFVHRGLWKALNLAW